MKVFAVLVISALIDSYVHSAPAQSIVVESLDGLKPKYLLMTIGPNYSTDRKPRWVVVYKNTVKKECVFREVDASTADTLAEAFRKKQTSQFPSHLGGLLIINDSNVSSYCDGFSTRYLTPVNTTSSSSET